VFILRFARHKYIESAVCVHVKQVAYVVTTLLKWGFRNEACDMNEALVQNVLERQSIG
jgi:hypothetical protein